MKLMRWLAFFALASSAFAVCPTTLVSDTWLDATNTPVNGTLFISWPSFQTAGGCNIQAGSLTAAVNAGIVSVNLQPTLGGILTQTGSAQPPVYSVSLFLPSGARSVNETWNVPPSGSSVSISQIECPAANGCPSLTVDYDVRGVASATVNGSGHLIITLTDTTQIDAGYVIGGGSGTVNSGATGQFAYYSASGTTVGGHTLVAGDIPQLAYGSLSGLPTLGSAAAAPLVTTLGTPGSNSNAVSEAAIRTAITNAVTGLQSALTFTGTGTKTVSASAPGASNNCVKWLGSGDIGDAGSPCGSGSGSGATIADVTNLIKGDGSGNGIDSGLTPASVVTLSGTQTLTNKSISSSEITGLGTAATQNTSAFDAAGAASAVAATVDIGNPGALLKFRQLLSKASSQIVRIKIFGDSISRCVANISCSSTTGPIDPTSLWPNVLRAALLNAGYPQYSTGMLPVVSGVAGSTTFIDGSVWTMSGTYATSTAIGPQQIPTAGQTMATLLQMSPSATATISAQTGKTLVVYCAEASDSSSGLNVSIDSTNVGTACGSTAGSATALAVTFTVTQGSHTVVLTANSTGHSYLYGAEWVGSNTYGVAVDNYSEGSIQALGFAGHTDFADLQSGDALAILALGTNEALNGISTGTYSTNLGTIATHEAGRGAAVLVFSEPPCNNSSCSTSQAGIVSAAESLAVSNGYGYLSAFTAWPSESIASAMNLYSDTNLHPNDGGQLIIAGSMNNYVLGGAAASTQAASAFVNGGLNILLSSANGSFNPMLALYNNSSVTGYDTLEAFINPSRQWRLGIQKSNSNFYLYDYTASNYAAKWDTGDSTYLTSTGNYTLGYLKNTSTGNNAFAGWAHQGQGSGGRTFIQGVGNATETVFGCANKWCLYDYTASALRASMDSTGIQTIYQGMRIPARPYASWTACSSSIDGTLIHVNDSTVTANAATIAGSGSNDVYGRCVGATPAYVVFAGTSSGSVTFSGNTTTAASVSGSITSGDCAKWDSSGNIVDAGAACGSGGGSLPSQTGTAGYLYTNGTSAYWGNIVTGGSGALDCATTPGQCDIVTAVVPLKASANGWTGLNRWMPANAATSSANQTGNYPEWESNFWNGSASAADDWYWSVSLATGTNPATTYTLNHSGSSGTATVDIPFPITVSSCTGCGGGGGGGGTIATTTNVLAGDGSGNAVSAGMAPSAVVTLTGTQTLTNKSISSSQITGLAASATTDTTNASNITSGTLAAAQLPAPTPPYVLRGTCYSLPSDYGYCATKPSLGAWAILANSANSPTTNTQQTNGNYALQSTSNVFLAESASTTSIEAVMSVSGIQSSAGGGGNGVFAHDSTNNVIYVCYNSYNTTSGTFIFMDRYTYSGSAAPAYSASSNLKVSNIFASDLHLKLSISGTVATCAYSLDGGNFFATAATSSNYSSPISVGTIGHLGIFIGGTQNLMSVVLH